MYVREGTCGHHMALPMSRRTRNFGYCMNTSTIKNKNINLPSPSSLDDPCSIVSSPALLFLLSPVCALRGRCVCGSWSFS